MFVLKVEVRSMCSTCDFNAEFKKFLNRAVVGGVGEEGEGRCGGGGNKGYFIFPTAALV